MKNSLSVLACRFYSTHSPLSQPLRFFALLAIALLERSSYGTKQVKPGEGPVAAFAREVRRLRQYSKHPPKESFGPAAAPSGIVLPAFARSGPADGPPHKEKHRTLNFE